MGNGLQCSSIFYLIYGICSVNTQIKRLAAAGGVTLDYVRGNGGVMLPADGQR